MPPVGRPSSVAVVVPAVRAGEPAERAVPRLVAAYGGRIYALASRLCRRPEDAEDLVQEIFLQAFRKWHQFDGRSSPTTWLFTIAARACQRMHRRRAGQPLRMESLDQLLPFNEPHLAVVPDNGGSPAEARVQREALEHLEQAIPELPADFRLPLVLKDVIGLSIEEVARTLNLKPATVKTRLHRARLRLRKLLVARLPKRDGPPPAYSRQVCLDLLRAKQDALDRGAAFPVREKVICERCQAVFATLDFTQTLCAQIAQGEMPPQVRTMLANLGA